MVKLTAKQEAFALYLFKDVKQRDAYTQAGYSSNMARTTIDENASRLAASSKIQARLAELRTAVASPAIAEAIERKTKLSKLLRETYNPEDVTPSHQLQAIDLLNKMDNLYADKPASQAVNIIFVIGKGYQELSDAIK